MKTRTFLFVMGLTCLLAIPSCKEQDKTREYTDWLYEYMPLPDSLQYSREWWEKNVQKTMEVRKNASWEIPEREFRHFVLPLRVNNETLDDFRLEYADTLCRRVKGMSLHDAALEINHWCHEQATYRPSDARTSAPMATVRRGLGRCGEESVLGVAALRAAGIPARQVYTPRWAHTDDNHAWVEVWIDGKWYFMGGCEPQPELNMGWFNGPVSRAMILHTKAFGDYKGDEDVITSTPCYTEINVIRGYVPARRTVVTVTENGIPAEGARVEFKIYNYAEFYTVASYLTGKDGKAGLDMGLGDMFIWASKGDRFGFAKAGGEDVTVELDHTFGEEFGADIDIVPPAENPIVVPVTEEQTARNDERFAQEDSIRMSHPHNNPDYDSFIETHPDPKAFLSAKDLTDIKSDMLEDAFGEGYVSSDKYLISPRVENENLRPFRKEILASASFTPESPEEIVQWVTDSIRIEDGRNPQNLRISPVHVWRSRMSDSLNRGIFFVAMCRTFGFPARINEVTGKVQYFKDGEWMEAVFGKEEEKVSVPTGNLKLSYSGDTVKFPYYYKHFTIAGFDKGKSRLLEFGTDADQTTLQALGEPSLEEGYYSLTSGTRLSDGSVLAHLEFFNIRGKETCTKRLLLRRQNGKLSILGSMDPENTFLPDNADKEQTLLSATGRGYFLLAIMGEKDEPTQHAAIELGAVSQSINKWGRKAVILDGTRPEGLENAVFGSDPDKKIRRMLSEGCQTPSAILPIVTVCDTFGNVVYFSQGYNTSLGADIEQVIGML